VDPFLRIVGARDAIALGDCSAMLGDRLPATAQVAGQQGAYIARMINRGYTVGIGGQDQPPPARSKDPSALQQATSKLLPLDVMALEEKEQLSELDVMAVVQNDSTYTQQVPSNVEFFRKPFEFLSLGIMAYVGNDKALTEVEAFDRVALRLYGAFAYLLWRSVYITKQVSFRNRVLVLRDWATTRFFGRDLSQF
jgi:NADH:ubiquinone reductase (non-electrogenic)